MNPAEYLVAPDPQVMWAGLLTAAATLVGVVFGFRLHDRAARKERVGELLALQAELADLRHELYQTVEHNLAAVDTLYLHGGWDRMMRFTADVQLGAWAVLQPRYGVLERRADLKALAGCFFKDLETLMHVMEQEDVERGRERADMWMEWSRRGREILLRVRDSGTELRAQLRPLLAESQAQA